jgi:ferredoxin
VDNLETIISSGACQPECSNEAIFVGGEDYDYNDKSNPALSQDFYYIVSEKCAECVGFHEEPMCASVCPTDACVKDKEESKDALVARAKTLHPDKNF